MSIKNGLLGFLGNLTPRKVDFHEGGSTGGNFGPDTHAEFFDGANVVTSQRTDVPYKRHAVLLDLDVPAYLIPSTTEGHSHLYIDVKATPSAYYRLLDALADCKVIERGYAEASKRKGATYLRLPWVKKDEPKLLPF